MAANNYKKFRLIKENITFTGAAFKGLNGSPIPFGYDGNQSRTLKNGEFIYEAFYRVTSPLTSGNLALTYLELGIDVNDEDCVLDSTTGILNTINTNAAGLKFNPLAYTKSTADDREIHFTVAGADDVTGGEMEIILVIANTEDEEIIEEIIESALEESPNLEHL